MSARRTFSSLGVALAIAACAKPADQAAMAPAVVDSAVVKAAVADIWTRWTAADIEGNVEALAALVGDSARLDFRGFPPIMGRAAFKVFAEGAVKATDITSLSIAPEMTIPISNELAYETGDYTEGHTTSGKKLTDYGRYAAAVGKDADGQWRVMYIMVFADSTTTAKK